MKQLFAYKTFIQHKKALYPITDVGLQCVDKKPYPIGVWITAPVGPFFGWSSDSPYSSDCNAVRLKVEIQDIVESYIAPMFALFFQTQEQIALAIQNKQTYLKREAKSHYMLDDKDRLTYIDYVPDGEVEVCFFKMRILP